MAECTPSSCGRAKFSRSGVTYVVGTSTAPRNWARVTLPT